MLVERYPDYFIVNLDKVSGVVTCRFLRVKISTEGAIKITISLVLSILLQ